MYSLGDDIKTEYFIFINIVQFLQVVMLSNL